MIEFRIEDQPDQQFELILERRRVTIRLRYNPTSDRWSFDLSIDDLPVLHGRRVVTGVDLLRPFDFGVGVLFAASVTPGAVPNRQQLPNGTIKLYQTTESEIETVVTDAFEPITPNERPVWKPRDAFYFGSFLETSQLIDNIAEGVAIDFTKNEMIIRSNADVSLNWIGTIQDAINAGILTFSRPSVAFTFDTTGKIVSNDVDKLRMKYHPVTGAAVGVVIEPASVNLVPSSAVLATGSGVTIDTNGIDAPSLTSNEGDLMIEDLTNAEHRAADLVVAGTIIDQEYFWSAFVKVAHNPRIVRLRLATAVSAYVDFDATTGQFVGSSGVVEVYGSEKCLNGFWRVWMVGKVVTAGNLVCRVQLVTVGDGPNSYQGDGVSGFYVWGRDTRLIDQFVEHFPTSGVAAGPSADDLTLDLTRVPVLTDSVSLQIDGVDLEPTIVADALRVLPHIGGQTVTTFRLVP